MSNLSNELEAVKTEVHKTNFNDSPDKINTFLQKAGVWSEKLEELFKHSKQQAQLVTDMAGTLETNADPVTEIANLNERITKLEQGTEKQERVNNLATDMAIFNKRLVSLEKDMGQHAAKLKVNNDLLTGIANITERVGQLEMKAHNQTSDHPW